MGALRHVQNQGMLDLHLDINTEEPVRPVQIMMYHKLWISRPNSLSGKLCSFLTLLEFDAPNESSEEYMERVKNEPDVVM